MKAHVPVYRPILKHALETAWIHRELWPIAAIAGLAGTGAVINDVLNQAKLAVTFPTSRFSEAMSDLHILAVYRDSLILATPEQITLGTLIILGLAVFIAITIAACQQLILRVTHNALRRKHHLTLTEIRREFVHPRIFRFLALDLFLKLTVINLMIVTAALVTSLNIGQIVSDAFFGVVFSSAALSLALSFNVLVMLALIGVARKNVGLGKALAYAWTFYRQHSFILLEMSVLLFAINFLISAIYDGTILVLGVPAVLSFIGALQTGSVILYTSLVAIMLLAVLIVTIIFAGFATTFTYAAWTALVEHLDKKTIAPRALVHTKRFFEHLK